MDGSVCRFLKEEPCDKTLREAGTVDIPEAARSAGPSYTAHHHHHHAPPRNEIPNHAWQRIHCSGLSRRLDAAGGRK